MVKAFLVASGHNMEENPEEEQQVWMWGRICEGGPLLRVPSGKAAPPTYWVSTLPSSLLGERWGSKTTSISQDVFLAPPTPTTKMSPSVANPWGCIRGRRERQQAPPTDSAADSNNVGFSKLGIMASLIYDKQYTITKNLHGTVDSNFFLLCPGGEDSKELRKDHRQKLYHHLDIHGM